MCYVLIFFRLHPLNIKMKPNLITLAILLILGNFTLLILPKMFLLPWQIAGAITILYLLIYTIWRKPLLLLLGFFTLSLGYAHHAAFNLLHQAESIKAEKSTMRFTIREILHQQDYQTFIATTKFDPQSPEQRIFLNWKAKERPKLGETWQAEVALRPLSARLNFGGFDRQQWYFSKAVIAVGTVKSAVKIGDEFSFRTEKLHQVQVQTEGLSQQGLLLALAFGERAWLDKNTWHIYQQTNTSHLIAISGLHIGLAMGIGFLLVRLLQLILPTRYIHPLFPLGFGVLFALSYAYLAGFSVPTFRAISALFFVTCIQMSRRHYPPFQLFILVIAFLLLCDPLMLLSGSFWLSVGAVLCLIIWYRFVPFSLFQWKHQPFSPNVRWLLGLFHLQFGLLLLFTPLQLFLFNGTAANGFIANLIAVPLYSFFLVPLILFAVFSNGTLFSWQISNAISEWITQIIAFFQGNWGVISFNLSLILTALCSLIFALIIYAIYHTKSVTEKNWQITPSRFFTLNVSKPLSAQTYKSALLLPLSISVLCLMILLVRHITQPNWRLETLDVGQGLATLIVKNGKGVLYDTGSAWQGGSMATLEILPYLQHEGIALEKVILSHDDNDHSGGTTAILQAYPNAELITPSQKNYAEHHHTFCTAGREWHWQDLHFQILSPKNIVARADNPHSCVILVSDGTFRVLLTGDAETKNEQIFARTLDKIDILQVGHHGSKTSTGEFLLTQTKPDIAIISSGRWNPWKFPHPTVVERLERHQSAIENTAISGQIRLNFFDNKWEVSRARTEFSPWYAYQIGFSRE